MATEESENQPKDDPQNRIVSTQNRGALVRLVVASPGDVGPERDAVESVCAELNQTLAPHLGFTLKCDRWENLTRPGLHTDGPQGIADAALQIPDCDVLIGLLWKRFGTPTTDADSGTEHEFNLAYETWKRQGTPDLSFYFKVKSYTPQTPQEAEQWAKVLAFRQRFPAEGLFWTFKETDEFKDLVRRHLTHLLTERAKNNAAQIANNAVSTDSATAGRLLGEMPPQNFLFTGREDELGKLHDALRSGDAALTPPPAALHGMGGVGKTQTAREYIARHGAEYAAVLWVRGENPEDFKAQMAGLAGKGFPPVPASNNTEADYWAMRRWLETNGGWLLVVDNAERLDELSGLLPRHPKGRVLLTTRERVPTTRAKSVEITHFDDGVGALLLLRRAGTLTHTQTLEEAQDDKPQDAKAVSAALGGLALALDQAGAYMLARGVPAATYLAFYQQRRQNLHQRDKPSDHDSVNVTFSLALEQVRQIPELGEAAAQLIQVCAFLAPDSIPDEIFLKGASELGDALMPLAGDVILFGDVYEAATRYALLRRDNNPPGLWMHRLAQEVVRDSLNANEQKARAEQVINAVAVAFPQPEFPAWPLCARLLPHALLCAQYVASYDLRTAWAAYLLDNTASYLQHHARYSEAEPLYVKALAIRKQLHGQEHEQVAAALNNLALLYREMGRYDEAVLHLKRAVAIDAKTIGEEHPGYAIRLGNLAGVYYYQRRYEEATSLWERTLEITRRSQGAEHPSVAIRLSNLANVYIEMARYGEAEAHLLEALDIARMTIGEQAPNYATYLLNLAGLYIKWNRLTEVEPLLDAALSIRQKAFDAQHPDIATCHSWLGELRYQQGRLSESAALFGQALAMWEGRLGAQHPNTIAACSWLAQVEQELAG